MSKFSISLIWLLYRDRSVSFVSVSRPSILVILLKERSSQVKLVCIREFVSMVCEGEQERQALDISDHVEGQAQPSQVGLRPRVCEHGA